MFVRRPAPPLYKQQHSATALTINFDHLFDFVNYYEYTEEIRGFVNCRLKRDLCTELRRGMLVDDIVMYTDGWLDIHHDGKKYSLQIMLTTPCVCVSDGET
jgi:hypothetical protein